MVLHKVSPTLPPSLFTSQKLLCKSVDSPDLLAFTLPLRPSQASTVLHRVISATLSLELLSSTEYPGILALKTHWLSSSMSISTYVQHKHMTPEEAYSYVKSIRPRVKLATSQWKAVLEYYHVRVLNTQSSLTDATSALIPRNVKQVCSGNVVVFEDGSMVVVTHSDVEGYDDSKRSMNVAGNELWVKVVGQAALARISCLCLGLREDHKLSRKNLSMSGIRVDISVY
ncbi:hypothetical protein F2Q70_00025022 [Brassica cretica]|uniref:Uncharacterized protein n=1 Tax=Brassica cretica TaxID=69181 RepID=A0A8S9L8G7_BRACR|nr:hypothetical protein F2Q70_00025022 [Brassica cretica]